MNVIRNRTNYKKKSNYGPKKVYRRRYTRIPRQLKGDDMTAVKCEAYSAIQVANGTIDLQFQSTNNRYDNINNILNNSNTFQDMLTRYSRYRINGISLRFDSCLLSNSTTIDQLPVIYIAFYPQLVSTNSGDGPLYNDKKAAFNPAVAVPQTKYLRFPENYFTAANGGYGTWNDITTWANITGQLSIYAPAVSYTATALTILGMLRVTLYVQFASKNI